MRDCCKRVAQVALVRGVEGDAKSVVDTAECSADSFSAKPDLVEHPPRQVTVRFQQK
jgi:hypothetical protein